MLGPDGGRMLIRGGRLDLSSPDDLTIDDDEARIAWPARVVSRIVFDPASRGGLRTGCTCEAREGACVHVAGLLSILLEQKVDLGLAAPPPELSRVEGEEELVAAAVAEREKRARTERMRIVSLEPSKPWTDYSVTSLGSGKTYRVALRGEVGRGASYCSCPDFRTNTLGTCKHIMKVLAAARRRFSPRVRGKAYRRTRVTVHVRYGERVELAVALPQQLSSGARAILGPWIGGETSEGEDMLLRRLQRLAEGGHAYFVTPDAEELIQRRLLAGRLAKLVAEIRAAPERHPLRTGLLKQPLLPFQLDGIAFAAGAGRAVLADEMGLGKTIQGVGIAELLAREVGVRRVLVVCPASLKSQWRSEIERFSGRSAEVVEGAARDRGEAYRGEAFFTICNYEQVLKDISHVERTRWDLIILDEGQRIKNWEAKTSRVVKGLVSRFALVLSGTPLENRLDDLHSVVAFVDPHRLGPSFRFLHRHQRRGEDGKLVGFKKLDELRARLAPVLLRRTRESVRLELPPRTVEIVRIPPTAEQKELHDGHMQTVAQIVRKPYLTEMDLLRLRMALLMCRMAADSTTLVDKQRPGWSTKLERLGGLFDQIAAEPGRKVIVFSEWTTMLDLIEPLLAKRKLGFVRLDGSVPQKKRQAIVSRFQNEKRVQLFLTTNAGSTGLNLQAANTIINVDLPWNPAVLEQRIARAHRMGQVNPVCVFVLVTEQTLEENLLATLSSKRELAMAALDPDSRVADVDVRTQADDIKEKLEVLLGAKPDAPIDASATVRAADDRLAETSASFVRAAFDLLGKLTGVRVGGAIEHELRTAFDVKIVADEAGNRRLSVAVPSRDRLASFVRGLAGLVDDTPRRAIGRRVPAAAVDVTN